MSDEEYINNYDSDKKTTLKMSHKIIKIVFHNLREKIKKIKHTIEVGNRLVKDNYKSKRQDRNPNNINCKHFHEIPILGTKEWKNA